MLAPRLFSVLAMALIASPVYGQITNVPSADQGVSLELSSELTEDENSGCAGKEDECFGCCNCCDGWMHRWDDCKWVKLGAGLRTSYNAINNGATNGTSTSADFAIDNMRIYLSGQGHERIGFELNTDIHNAQFADLGATPFEDGGDIRILDAVIKLKLTDHINLWAGRFLPPSDRSNLSGPFYLNAWSFPYTQFGYPNIFQGRDDGAALWGQFNEGQFKWQIGAFEGNQNQPQGDDDLMLTGRLVLNLLDPEPGYYNASTYYGEKEILAIGLSFMHQDNAVGIPGDARSFTGWNLDVLFETKLANCGVVTLEGAYYDFDDNDAAIVDTAGLFTPVARQGQSFFILGSYLIPRNASIGCLDGRFQPYVRYLDYDRDFATATSFNEGLDVGLNFIMDGHNARITAVYEQRNAQSGAEVDGFRIGTQIQF